MQPIHIILGPPRSGLNTLTGCLRLMGLNPPSGHQDPETINQLLFQDLGSSPLSPAPLPRDWQKSSAAEKARQRIHELLTYNLQPTTYNLQPTTYIASSLLCRTLPLWTEAFQQKEFAPIFILMLRHPFETASSIAAAENLDLTRAHLTWLAYTREAQLALDDEDHTLITFDQLLADPITTLNSLQPTTYNLKPITFNPQPATCNLITHVQPSLKHHHAGDMTEQDRQDFEPYERFYLKIRAASHQPRKSSSSMEPNELLPLIDSILAAAGRQENKGTPQAQKPATSSEPPLQASIVFPASKNRKETKETIPLIENEWQNISLAVPEPELLKKLPIRIVPLNSPGLATISAIKLINRASGNEIWDYNNSNEKPFSLQGTVLQVPDEQNLSLLITGYTCEIKLVPPQALPDSPVTLDIWLKVSKDQGVSLGTLQSLVSLDTWQAILETAPEKTNASDYQKIAANFSNVGRYDLADGVLSKGVAQKQYDIDFMQDYAEISVKRGNWAEAVRRWQLIIDKHGQNTPAHIYDHLDRAYRNAGSFGGKPEEEVKQGEIDYMVFLERVHSALKPDLYLEIGIGHGKSLALANCEAIGIDPMPQINIELSEKTRIYKTTSNEFFQNQAANTMKKPPDLVFIDGMHLYEYVLRDFMNVERSSAIWTFIIVDDIFPNHPVQAQRIRQTGAWTGDVWKLYETLKRYRPDLLFLPVNTRPTGLLLIAGLDPLNKILQDNYETIVSEYPPDMRPPGKILRREGIFSAEHEAIPAVLETLKTARSKSDLKPADIAGELKSALFETKNQDRT